MKNTMRYIITFSLMIFLIFSGFTNVIAKEKMKVFPDNAIAGTYQQFIFEFISDSSKIEIGGGIRIELPVAYLETKPYYWAQPQQKESQAPGFVNATSSGDAIVEITTCGSYNRIIECIVQKNPLKLGDSIQLHYQGNVQSFARKLVVRAQWRQSENDPWHNIYIHPIIQILPQKATTMLLVTPADVQQAKPFEMVVVLLDKFGNRATNYRGTVTFSSSDSNRTIPNSYTFSVQDSGVHVFEKITFMKNGFQCINASDGEIKAVNNYSYVSESKPKLKRLFGDTHYHTGTGTTNHEFTKTGRGGDHRGHHTSAINAYQYARDVMRLDFASTSEHDNGLLAYSAWNRSQEITESFNLPGKFTTFFAYEWTSPSTSHEGHHIILYKNKGNKVFGYSEYDTKHELWNAFDKQNLPAIMIPHCTWTKPNHAIWDKVNNNYRIIGEIYSLWNNRFLIQPGDDTQRFELSVNNKWSYQYAWANGHKIGVIGSSDNHTGLPGLNNFTTACVHAGGLAVVLAKENDRDNIWDGFQNRHTFATTGTRIYLDFTCDGHLMGSEYSTNEIPLLAVKVAGTNKIELIEIVKFDGNEYKTIYTVKPENRISIFQFKDENFTEDSIYYVRVKQVDEIWRSQWAYGNAEMAWSSPIWVNYIK